MAKAKKLPSGNYRARVFSHVDSNGKKVYASFTAPTKAEAEARASQYAYNKKRIQRNDMTVKEAVYKYIEVKDGVLSDSTIAGYYKVARLIKGIDNIRISKLSSADLQAFISDHSQGRSPKTVKNNVGLVLAAINMFQPEIRFHVTLPMYVKKKARVPLDSDIQALMNAASRKMKLAIALGCRSARRGEICAIKYKDIKKIDKNNYSIHIHGDCVQNKNGEWIYKNTPKTPESDRFILVPKEVIDLIEAKNPDDYIVDIVPSTITGNFTYLKNKLGISMTFHDTRHYYASIMAAIGVPDFATAEMGGWRHVDRTMKEIYQGVQEDRKIGYLKIGNEHLASLLKDN